MSAMRIEYGAPPFTATDSQRALIAAAPPLACRALAAYRGRRHSGVDLHADFGPRGPPLWTVAASAPSATFRRVAQAAAAPEARGARRQALNGEPCNVPRARHGLRYVCSEAGLRSVLAQAAAAPQPRGALNTREILHLQGRRCLSQGLQGVFFAAYAYRKPSRIWHTYLRVGGRAGGRQGQVFPATGRTNMHIPGGGVACNTQTHSRTVVCFPRAASAGSRCAAGARAPPRRSHDQSA